MGIFINSDPKGKDDWEEELDFYDIMGED